MTAHQAATAARKEQIIDAAIAVLAERGYHATTLEAICASAGLSSKRLITYHFGGKDELLRAVVAEVFAAATDAVRPRVDAESAATGKLRAYLDARVRFLATHRRHMLALFEIWTNFRAPDGELRLGEGDARATVDAIERILREGQRSGEFASFSTAVMAMVIRQAVDGVLLQLRADPDLDLDTYARELIALFDGAVRRGR